MPSTYPPDVSKINDNFDTFAVYVDTGHRFVTRSALLLSYPLSRLGGSIDEALSWRDRLVCRGLPGGLRRFRRRRLTGFGRRPGRRLVAATAIVQNYQPWLFGRTTADRQHRSALLIHQSLLVPDLDGHPGRGRNFWFD